MNLYAYVANDPVNATDPTGRVLETPWDAANVALGVASFGANVATGNVVGAVVDAVGIAYDVSATAVPGLPGGAGAAIKAARTADAAADAARALAKTCCFVAGTLVETETGLFPIETIKVGEQVWAWGVWSFCRGARHHSCQ